MNRRQAMTHNYRTIAIDQIDAHEDRIRALDPNWVKLLAEEIEANGLKEPIRVREEFGKVRLIDGARRIAAYVSLGRQEIAALVDASDEALKLSEVKAHLLRGDLSALEHAVAISAWCDIYRDAQGPQKRGPKPAMPAGDNELEEFSATLALNWSEAAQQALGIGRRSVFRSLKIASVDGELRRRIALLPVAKVQRELLLLAEQSPAMQAAIVDMLCAIPATAESVTDALAALGAMPSIQPEPAYSRLSEKFARLPEKDQFAFFALHESAIDLWLAKRANGARKAA